MGIDMKSINLLLLISAVMVYPLSFMSTCSSKGISINIITLSLTEHNINRITISIYKWFCTLLHRDCVKFRWMASLFLHLHYVDEPGQWRHLLIIRLIHHQGLKHERYYQGYRLPSTYKSENRQFAKNMAFWKVAKVLPLRAIQTIPLRMVRLHLDGRPCLPEFSGGSRNNLIPFFICSFISSQHNKLPFFLYFIMKKGVGIYVLCNFYFSNTL